MSNQSCLASFLRTLALPEVRHLERNGATSAEISEEIDSFLRAKIQGLVDTAEAEVGHRLPHFSFDGVRGDSRHN